MAYSSGIRYLEPRVHLFLFFVRFGCVSSIKIRTFQYENEKQELFITNSSPKQDLFIIIAQTCIKYSTTMVLKTFLCILIF